MAEEFTAKFSIDISDLKKNIADAQQSIKMANATFRKETSGMDKWSTNADGLSAKLKQLRSTVDSQKKILESYQGQLKKVKEKYKENSDYIETLKAKMADLAANGVSKTSEEYRGYQKALTNAEHAQATYEKSINDLNLKVETQEAVVGETERAIRHYTDAQDNLGKETEDTTEAVEKSSDGYTVLKGVLADLASTAIKAVVEGLKDLGKAAIESYKEFDEGMDNIIKRTGATGEAAADLQKAYKGAAGRVVGDLGDIGDAVGEVNTRFGLQGDELEDLSVKFLKYAELNGTDVASSIDSVQAAMAAFNVESDSAGDVLDILNKAAQDTGVPLDKLTSTLLSNGTALQEMGFGLNTATGFLAGLEKSGVDTSSTLAGLKKALQNATKEGKPMDEALAEIQKSMQGAASDTEAAQKASELFGAKAGPAIAAAVRDGRLSFDELTNTVTDWGDSVENTFASTQDAGDYVTLAMQNIKVATGEALGEFIDEHAPQIQSICEDFTNNLLPALIDVFGGLLDGLSWLADHGDAIIAVLAGIAAGVGTYIAYQTALTVMTQGWTALTVVTKAQTIAQTALNAVMAANPIGIVITVIMALVAAFAVLWNTNEGFRQAVINLWNALKTNVVAAVEAIKSGVVEKWNSLKASVSSAVESIKSKVTNVWNSVKAKTSSVWNSIKSSITTPINNAKAAVQKAVDAIRNKINNVKISFPKIKLPHFSVSGGQAPWGLMGQGSMPKISVSWYARGGIVNRPSLIGVGENGSEAVVPLERNKYWIKEVARSMTEDLRAEAGSGGLGAIAQGGGGTNFTQIINAPKQPSRIQLYRQTRNLLKLKGGMA